MCTNYDKGRSRNSSAVITPKLKHVPMWEPSEGLPNTATVRRTNSAANACASIACTFGISPLTVPRMGCRVGKRILVCFTVPKLQPLGTAPWGSISLQNVVCNEDSMVDNPTLTF